MAVTSTPIFPQSVVNTGAIVAHGTGLVQFCAAGTATGTMIPFFAAGANGSILTAIMVQNLDTATCTMAVMLSTGGGGGTFVQVLGIAAISGASQGTGYSVPAANLLNGTQGIGNLPFDSCGNRILYVAAGSTLNVGLLSTIINGSSNMYVNAIGGNL
jgi:hypothetical protein